MRFVLLLFFAIPCAAFETLDCAWDSARPISYSVPRCRQSKLIQGAMDSALNKWCVACSGAFQFENAPGGITVKFGKFYFGAAYTTRVIQNGKITSATIVLNSRYRWCRKPIGIILRYSRRCEADLDAVLTHEIGHALGMEHSSVESAAMWPIVYPSTATLTQDDVDGICSLYHSSP